MKTRAFVGLERSDLELKWRDVVQWWRISAGLLTKVVTTDKYRNTGDVLYLLDVDSSVSGSFLAQSSGQSALFSVVVHSDQGLKV